MADEEVDFQRVAEEPDVEFGIKEVDSSSGKKNGHLSGLVCGYRLTEKLNGDFYRAVAGEFFGTLMFLWYTITAVVFFRVPTFDVDSSPAIVNPSFTEGDSATQLMIAFSFGISIAVLVYWFAGVSGGHINPAVSLGLFVCKRVTFLRAAAYTAVQMAGAIVGTAIAKGINPELFDAANGGANGVAPGLTDGEAFLGELMGTAGLVFTVCMACDKRNAGNFMSALTIGLSVFLAHVALIPITGTSINPARSFGSAVIADAWDDQWLFWIAPYTGAIVAALVYQVLFRSKDD